MNKLLLSAALILAAALASTAELRADTVATKDGSTIQGKILHVSGGVIEIETTFAGVLKIQQATVVSLATDSPVSLRYQGGNTVRGTLSTAEGEVRVAGPGALDTGAVSKVETVWTKDSDSPEARAAAAARSTWGFEASVDVVGTKGNSDSMATAVGFAATLAGPTDKLVLYAAYSRADQGKGEKKETNTNNAKGGADYSAYFTPRSSWYVREEVGTDKIKDLDLYSNTAGGIGYAFIRKPKQELTARAGLAYRYEAYSAGADLGTAALDLGLAHSYSGSSWRVGNKLTFMPSLEDFANYRIQHDSFFEIPLASTKWKVRLGLANDYNSQPKPGKEKLDTTYYTKFLLSWK
jgi:hypothetical protein